MDELAKILIPIGVIGSLILVMILALVWQKKGLSGQQKGLSYMDESMAISRRNLELAERRVALAEESNRNQQEIIKLLRRDADQRWMKRDDHAS